MSCFISTSPKPTMKTYRYSHFSVAAALALLSLPSIGFATDYSYNTASGLNWNNATGWSAPGNPGGFPDDSGDNVVGNIAGSGVISLNGSFTIGDFTPTSTGLLVRGSGTVSSSLTMDEVIMNPQSATITASFANTVGMPFSMDITVRQVTVTGTAFAPTLNFGAAGGSQNPISTVNITEGVRMNGASNVNFAVTGSANIGLISYSSDAGTKTMNVINTGSISLANTIVATGISGSSANALSIRTTNSAFAGSTQTGTLALNVASGTSYTTNAVITNGTGGSGANTMALVKSGSGTQAFTAITGTFTGGTQINAGTLLVNNASGNAIGTGNITVAAAGTLGGTGFIALTSGNTVTVSGAIAPGDAGIESLSIANDVTWNGGTNWKWELGTSGTTDQLLITGAGSDLLKGTGSTWRFDFQNTGVVNNTYVLVDWAGTTTFSSTDFSYTGLASGLTGTFAFNGSQLEFTTATVPEPGSIALIGGGLLTLGVIFRRRSRSAR